LQQVGPGVLADQAAALASHAISDSFEKHISILHTNSISTNHCLAIMVIGSTPLAFTNHNDSRTLLHTNAIAASVGIAARGPTTNKDWSHFRCQRLNQVPLHHLMRLHEMQECKTSCMCININMLWVTADASGIGRHAPAN
jgi:hypothetical protein